MLEVGGEEEGNCSAEEGQISEIYRVLPHLSGKHFLMEVEIKTTPAQDLPAHPDDK